METRSNEILEAERSLRDFFHDPKTGLFVLKGKYGSGKSFFLREQILKKSEFREKFKFLSYTSVFGLNDIGSLNDVAIGSVEPGSLKLKAAWVEKCLQGILKIAGNIFTPLKGVSLSSTSAIWSLAKRVGLLLVIDDVDRKGDGLALKDLVGFANTLVEHSDSKVKIIVVVNEDELDEEKAVWEALREKFIDSEFSFDPSPRELANHFVNSDLSRVIGDIHVAFDSPNIRTMLKIERRIREMIKRFRIAEIALTSEEIESAVKLTGLFYRAGKNYTVDDLEKGASFLNALFSSRNDTKDKDSPEAHIQKDTALIQYFSAGDLDKLFLEFLRHGKLNESELDSLRRTRLESAFADEYSAKAREVWGLIHRSMSDNSEKFIESASAHLKEFPNMPIKDVTELADGVDYLGGDSTPMWKKWLEDNPNAVNPIYYSELRKRVPESLKSLIPESEETKTTVEADPERLFEAMETNEKFPTDEERKALASWKEQDWIDWFDSSTYSNALYGMRQFLQTNWQNFPDFLIVEKRLKLALTTWLGRSAINRFRAERYFPQLVEKINEGEDRSPPPQN